MPKIIEDSAVYTGKNGRLYELGKVFMYTAVVQDFQSRTYAVITKPNISDYGLLWWRTKQDGFKSRTKATKTAKELDQMYSLMEKNQEIKNVAEDIDDLISKSYISNFNYDLDEAFNKIIEKHSEFEVAQAVALTINAKSWDGRFSQLNKAWADNFITFNGIKTEEYDRFYGCNTHSALLDGFTDVVRKNIANRSITELRGESIAEEQLVKQSAGRK